MATVKLSLFNAETDILVEVSVSAADAERASTDTAFATHLFESVLHEHQKTPTAADRADENLQFSEVTENVAEEEFLDTEDGYPNSGTQESEVSLYRWNTPCVLLLLEAYKSLENDFNSGKISQKKVWEKISNDLKLKGLDVTGPQCSSKLRSLKKSYKSIKDHNSKTGNDKRNWQYLDIMEDLFGKKAWCDPVAVASSTGISKKTSETNNNLERSDSGCSQSTKSNKTRIANLLEKRIRQKEEHEEQKNKRHKERMEMDQKFLSILEKMINK